MLSVIATVLALLLSVGIAAIGVRFLVAPRIAAAGYGVPAATDHGDPAYLSVKGGRDIAVGLVGVLLALFAGHLATGLFMLAMTVAPLADAVIVLRNGGSKATAFGVHVSTAVVMLVDVALLFLS